MEKIGMGMMGKEIKKLYTSKGLTPPKGKGLHTKKFHEIASSVMAKGGNVNPYAVAMAKLGRNKAVKKSHQSSDYKKVNPSKLLKGRT